MCKTRLLRYVACLLLLIIVVFAVIGIVCNDFGIKTWQHIDVNSGRIRKQTLVFGLVATTSMVDTPFSRLAEQFSLTTEPARWQLLDEQTYSISGVGRGSGPYSYAPSACSTLTKVFTLFELKGFPLSEKEKKEKVARYLQLMRTGRYREMLAEGEEMLDHLDHLGDR